MKYYTAFALAALIAFLPCAEIAYSSDIDVYTRPHRKCNLQASLELQPQNDRVIVRIINASNVTESIDIENVDLCKIRFDALWHGERPPRREEEKKVVEERMIEVGETGGCNESETYISTVPSGFFSTGRVHKKNALLPPGAFIGAYVRSADIVIFKALSSAVLRAGPDGFWTFEYALSVYNQNSDGGPITLECLGSLDSNEIRITKEMIAEMLAARTRVDAEEAGIRRQQEPLKEVDRFRVRLSLLPDTDALMIDVVCVNPEPGKDERPTSFQQRQIHMKTLSTASWQWHLKAGDKTLYESKQTESADKADYSKPGNCPRLEKGQLVGQIVRFSESPIFPAVEKFFAETKSRTAACAVRLKLELYFPDEDGNPREGGELVSGWTVVTTQDYQRIRESALARMQEDKLERQPNR